PDRNHNGVALDGRTLIDCEGFTYEVAAAMTAAGFNVEAVTRDPLSAIQGASHVVALFTDATGHPIGGMSNGAFFPPTLPPAPTDDETRDGLLGRMFQGVDLGPDRHNPTTETREPLAEAIRRLPAHRRTR